MKNSSLLSSLPHALPGRWAAARRLPALRTVPGACGSVRNQAQKGFPLAPLQAVAGVHTCSRGARVTAWAGTARRLQARGLGNFP